MRVQRTLPPFTMRLSGTFVNEKNPISTGFLGFYPIFTRFMPFLPDFARFLLTEDATVHRKQHALVLLESLYQRRIQRFHQRRDQAKTLHDFANESVAECGFWRQSCCQSPLTAENEIHGGMLFWKALRRPRQPHSVEAIHLTAKSLVVQQVAYFLMILQQVFAN